MILHLEEAPEDPQLQKELNDLVIKLKESLFERYPEFEGNLLSIFTSNYSAVAPSIVEESVSISMVCPDQSTQMVWLKGQLVTDLKGWVDALALSEIRVDFQNPLFFSSDMREMEKVHMSLSYFICRHILSSLSSLSPSPKQIETLQIVVRQLDLSSIDVEINSLSSGSEQIVFDPLSLKSNDSLFFSPVTVSLENSPFLSLFSQGEKQEIHAICSMCWDSYISPGVIMMAGLTRNELQERAEMIQEYYQKIANSEVLSQDVRIETEKDLESVFGDPTSPSLSGLPLFIDQITNPVHAKVVRGGLVVAFVNEFGQYSLRELVESGNSDTHRTSIRKERILFVVCVEKGCQITPQMASRAQTTLLF